MTIRKVIAVILPLLLLGLLHAPVSCAGNWQVPGGTRANFTIDGMLGIDVNGTLDISNATISFDPANPQAGAMDVVLSVSTIATGIGKRDKHLKSDDYFDAAKYPTISFKSSDIRKDGSNFKVTGTLSIRNVSRTITIPFSFTQSGANGTFKGSFNMLRSTYGIGTGKENGMGNEVRIKLNIPVKKA